jgi:hypothetical protein
MGAWGVGNFDNDDAADWVYELAESDGTNVLVGALEAATSEGYLEAPIACVALAAAEIVAALLGNAGKAPPDDVRKWLGQNGGLEVDHDLLTLSRAAVMRVKENSELRELWQDSGDYEQWLSLQGDLLKRLGAG